MLDIPTIAAPVLPGIAGDKQRRAATSHLQRLEAESIHIMREVAAEFGNPVMLYSIGKDSSVMLHLAMKAFYPCKPPFPLMHVDTTWKFREMIAFRDRTRARARARTDRPCQRRRRQRRASIRSATVRAAYRRDENRRRCGRRSTTAASTRRSAVPAATKRSRVPRSASSRSEAPRTWDPKNQRPELWNLYNALLAQGREHARFPALELDRARRLAIHPDENIPIVPLYFAKRAAGGRSRRRADHGR